MCVATRYATHQEVECKYVKGGLAVANKIDDIFGKADRTVSKESWMSDENYAYSEMIARREQEEEAKRYQSLPKWKKFIEDIPLYLLCGLATGWIPLVIVIAIVYMID